MIGVLPSNVEAEKLVLGSILKDEAINLPGVAHLTPADFSIEAHRRIYSVILHLYNAGSAVDRVTVANELNRRKQLESVGIANLVSLDDGLPQIYNLDSYARMVSETALRRRFAVTANAAIEAVCSSDGDAATVTREIARLSELATGDGHGEPLLQGISQIVESHGGMNSFFNAGNTGKTVTVPFAALQAVLAGGFRPGQLITVGARPGVGKSALAVQLAIHAAEHGSPTAFYSLEMSSLELLHRAVSARAEVPLQSIRRNRTSSNDRRALSKAIAGLSSLPLWISDRTGATPAAILNSVRQRKAKCGLDLVIVDYLQLLSGGGRHERRVEEIGYISRALKLMARDQGVAVVAAAQLNRASASDSRKPMLHDLRDSGSIEQDSDVVFLLHHNATENTHELIVAKHRNGPRGTIPLWFNEKHVRFEEPVSG